MNLVQGSLAGWDTLRELARGRRLGRMRKAVMTGARLHGESCDATGERWNCLMVTLTYRPGEIWTPKHVTRCLDNAGKWARRQGFGLRYVWVMELTRAGVPHYHVLLWVPKRLRLPMFDKAGWWSYGMTNTVVAVAPVRYVAKYASKAGEIDRFPRGARLFGVGGLGAGGRVTLRFWRASKRVRANLGSGADIRPVSGGFVDRITGLFSGSGWRRWIDADGNIHLEEVPC